MDEKAIDPPIPLLPSPRLMARVQLWHWSEEEGWSLELNSQLACRVAHCAPSDWEVCLVGTPDTARRAGQAFVPIETDLVHRKIAHNDPMAQHEWNKLWRMILEFTPKFFKDIGGEVIIVQMMSPTFHPQGQKLFVATETCGPLKLREKITPTRRPRPGWFARWENRLSFALTLGSYAGFIPWSFTMKATLAMQAASSIMEHINRRMQSSRLLSDDPVQRIAQTFGNYRNQYATYNDYMSETQQTLCPDIGIRKVEACLKMLTAFGEFEHATLSFLTESIEPENARNPLYNALYLGGAACFIGGAVVSFGTWWVAWTVASKCAGGVALAGGVASVIGFFDPNRSTRELIKKVRDFFKSLKIELHNLYVRTWVSFYQRDLGVPFNQMSKEEHYELLKSCGVDLRFIQEFGYQEALTEASRRKLQSDNEQFMEAFCELFKEIGHEMIFQDVQEGH